MSKSKTMAVISTLIFGAFFCVLVLPGNKSYSITVDTTDDINVYNKMESDDWYGYGGFFAE